MLPGTAKRSQGSLGSLQRMVPQLQPPHRSDTRGGCTQRTMDIRVEQSQNIIKKQV